MAALLLALRELPEEAEVTIVHDYVGVRNWMEGDSKPPKDPALKAVLAACVDLRDGKGLSPSGPVVEHVHRRSEQEPGRVLERRDPVPALP